LLMEACGRAARDRGRGRRWGTPAKERGTDVGPCLLGSIIGVGQHLPRGGVGIKARRVGGAKAPTSGRACR
jgi:hypothetical protein